MAPFWERLNYDSFTFNIPQAMWMADTFGCLHWIMSQPDFVYRQMFAAMQEARKALLWRHPQSRTIDWLMREVSEAVCAQPHSTCCAMRVVCKAGVCTLPQHLLCNERRV